MFEKEPVEVQHFKKIVDHFKEMFRVRLKLVKERIKSHRVTSRTWEHYDIDRLCPKKL